jgi:hypothetical protein
MTPTKMIGLLAANKIEFSTRAIANGTQFRFADGAMANVYERAAIIWQVDTDTSQIVRRLCAQSSGDKPVPHRVESVRRAAE